MAQKSQSDPQERAPSLLVSAPSAVCAEAASFYSGRFSFFASLKKTILKETKQSFKTSKSKV
jgi:hypothetical protein